jgi:hypothetical protein
MAQAQDLRPLARACAHQGSIRVPLGNLACRGLILRVRLTYSRKLLLRLPGLVVIELVCPTAENFCYIDWLVVLGGNKISARLSYSRKLLLRSSVLQQKTVATLICLWY